MLYASSYCRQVLPLHSCFLMLRYSQLLFITVRTATGFVKVRIFKCLNMIGGLFVIKRKSVKKYMRPAILFICIVLIVALASGCGSKESSESDNKIKIMTTIFPEYDWVKNILGSQTDNVDLVLLVDDGVDLHSYEPSAEDISTISDCDLFIYTGGESDDWVDDALDQATNKDMEVMNLMDVLGDSVKTEEAVEGMQEEEHEHDEQGDEDHEDSDHEDEEGHEEEKDEHVWLSLKNAEKICSEITERLDSIDPENKSLYDENEAAYAKELAVLDSRYKETVDNSKRKTVLFADRFPFRYIADDYDLKYYAAFAGCSAETEASFETVKFLAEKVDELDLPCVLTIEGAKHKIAETVISNTSSKDQKILTMDSMQSVSSDDVKDGASYISIMGKNLDVLKEALN